MSALCATAVCVICLFQTEMKLFKQKKSRKILTTLYPDICPYCRKVINSGDYACIECKGKFNGIIYRKFAQGNFPCVSAVPYEGMFASAIRSFKFSEMRQFDYPLARIMAEAIATECNNETFDLITYVPLHKKNLAKRGYNQSELLANCLSQILNIPVVNTLNKTRYTKPQHKVKGKKRAENVKGAYKIEDKEAVKNKHILLIDDIITTGNTLGECAKTLDKCSPASIYCATFAITLPKTT